jgi:alkylated DNA repair dioxygenase AlkB
MIGNLAPEGFSEADLRAADARFQAMGCATELITLHDPANFPGGGGGGDLPPLEKAWVLVVRDAITPMLAQLPGVPEGATVDHLFAEHLRLKVDRKAKMRGRVVNKHARYNVCYGETSQDPDYEEGKGTVVAFDEVPLLQAIREGLPRFIGAKSVDLQAELNKYYDVAKCGIGFHGDSERKLVAAIRLGASIPLHYQWFHQGSPIGTRVRLTLQHGDLYVMSEKATGFDWKRRKIPTLRHAAGCKKYLTIKGQGC